MDPGEGEARVAAFAMPDACQAEGHTAEKRKGTVRSLANGAKARFLTQVGDKNHAASGAALIEGHQQ